MAWDISRGLRVWWSKRERDWTIEYPNRPDGHLMCAFMSGRMTFDELVKELANRGYDTTTLRFVVMRKAQSPTEEGKENG